MQIEFRGVGLGVRSDLKLVRNVGIEISPNKAVFALEHYQTYNLQVD
jgi:hypothetical protein